VRSRRAHGRDRRAGPGPEDGVFRDQGAVQVERERGDVVRELGGKDD